jgi:hypothetical protein
MAASPTQAHDHAEMVAEALSVIGDPQAHPHDKYAARYLLEMLGANGDDDEATAARKYDS